MLSNQIIRFMLTLSIGAAAICSISGCEFPPRIYRMNVRQGNNITPEMISQLKPGLTKLMVRKIMGSPTLTHFFEQDRWDYYYYLKPGTGAPVVEKPFSIYFKGDKVVRWESK